MAPLPENAPPLPELVNEALPVTGEVSLYPDILLQKKRESTPNNQQERNFVSNTYLDSTFYTKVFFSNCQISIDFFDLRDFQSKFNNKWLFGCKKCSNLKEFESIAVYPPNMKDILQFNKCDNHLS